MKPHLSQPLIAFVSARFCLVHVDSASLLHDFLSSASDTCLSFFSSAEEQSDDILHQRRKSLSCRRRPEEINRYEILVVFCGGWSGTHAVTMVHHS
jgi:hypothetical protein